MLIDLAIVTLISILYYLLCSRSRIINFLIGIVLILILCWSVGVNVKFATIFSESLYVMIALIINIGITINGHHLTKPNDNSRIKKFHLHNHDHIYAVRNRLNNFHLKKIDDRFKATPSIYLKTVTNQINHFNQYISQHSDFADLDQLIKSLRVLKSEIDNINYHLDLSMQLNFPRGLKRLIHQYHYIINQYQAELTATNQDRKIVDIMSHGAVNPQQNNVYLDINLKFPYQRLTHDRFTHHVDLLVVNQTGVFAFTLLNTTAKRLNVNQDDTISTQSLILQPLHRLQTSLNLKKQINTDYESVNSLIPKQFNVTPKVAVVCTNPHVTINLANPQFKILKPQDIEPIMVKLPVRLTPLQVKQLARSLRSCFTAKSKSEWLVFSHNTKQTIASLIWYQSQLAILNHKFLAR